MIMLKKLIPAKYPKLKRAFANSGMKAQSTIDAITACKKAGCPAVLLPNTVVIEMQATRMETISNKANRTLSPKAINRLEAFIATAILDPTGYETLARPTNREIRPELRRTQLR